MRGLGVQLQEWLVSPLVTLSIDHQAVAITPECLGLRGTLILGLLAMLTGQGPRRWAVWAVGWWSALRLALILALLAVGLTRLAWWYHDVGAVVHFAILSWCFITKTKE